jgi:hypothetical protein
VGGRRQADGLATSRGWSVTNRSSICLWSRSQAAVSIRGPATPSTPGYIWLPVMRRSPEVCLARGCGSHPNRRQTTANAGYDLRWQPTSPSFGSNREQACCGEARDNSRSVGTEHRNLGRISRVVHEKRQGLLRKTDKTRNLFRLSYELARGSSPPAASSGTRKTRVGPTPRTATRMADARTARLRDSSKGLQSTIRHWVVSMSSSVVVSESRPARPRQLPRRSKVLGALLSRLEELSRSTGTGGERSGGTGARA